MNGDARVSARRRKLDIAGGIAALVGIAGIFLDRSLLPVWAFLILFGVTTVPERLFRWVRERRQR